MTNTATAISAALQQNENDIVNSLGELIESKPETIMKVLGNISAEQKEKILGDKKFWSLRAKIVDAVITAGETDIAYEMAVKNFNWLTTDPFNNLAEIKVRCSEMDKVADSYWKNNNGQKAINTWEKKQELLSERSVMMSRFTKKEKEKFRKENKLTVEQVEKGWYGGFGMGWQVLREDHCLYSIDMRKKPGTLFTQWREAKKAIKVAKECLETRAILQDVSEVVTLKLPEKPIVA